MLRTDQGREFTDNTIDRWTDRNHMPLRLTQAGKPTTNPCVESFNGKFCYECLNKLWFRSLAAARDFIGAWRVDHSQRRQSNALGSGTPAKFAVAWCARQPGTPGRKPLHGICSLSTTLRIQRRALKRGSEVTRT